MEYTDGKVTGSEECIKLGLFYGKVIGTILENLYGTSIGFDVGTELVCADWSLDGSNYGKLEGVLLWGSLGSTFGKVLGTILGNVDGITLGLDVGTDLGSLNWSFGNTNQLIRCPKPHWLHLFLCQILIWSMC